MELKEHKIGSDNFRIYLSLDLDSSKDDPSGYFKLEFGNEAFGDFEIYTYVGIIADQFKKFINKKATLIHKIFLNKTDEDIFDLIYTLSEDWAYSENLTSEQININSEFFFKYRWISEEAMDYESIYVLFEKGYYKFLCKHLPKGSDVREQPLFVFQISEQEFEDTINIFNQILRNW